MGESKREFTSVTQPHPLSLSDITPRRAYALSASPSLKLYRGSHASSQLCLKLGGQVPLQGVVWANPTGNRLKDHFHWVALSVFLVFFWSPSVRSLFFLNWCQLRGKKNDSIYCFLYNSSYLFLFHLFEFYKFVLLINSTELGFGVIVASLTFCLFIK